MSKFEIGDRVRCTNKNEVILTRGAGFEQGKEFIVYYIDPIFGENCYFAEDRDGVFESSLELVERKDTSNEEWILPKLIDMSESKAQEKTLDNLEVGDIIVNKYGEGDKEIGAVGPRYVVTLDIYDDTNDPAIWVIGELKRGGFKLKQPAPITELTLEEVAKRLNIPVEQLRIKDL